MTGLGSRLNVNGNLTVGNGFFNANVGIPGAAATGTLDILDGAEVDVDGFFNLGGGDVEASIAGLPVEAFSANFTDATAAGFAGIGFNHENGNWSLKTSFEGRYGSDAYSEIRATATAAVNF